LASSDRLAPLLDAVARPRTTPSAGAAAAWACGLAAALVEMAGGERAGPLRARALDLADRDAEAYDRVLAGDATVVDAAGPPLEIAEVGAALVEMAAEAARTASARLRGEALTAVLLAEGACRSAALLVQINLEGTDDGRLARARDLARRAAALRAEAVE
jgi:formiminotetrahydrofolate cyclodeaminase